MSRKKRQLPIYSKLFFAYPGVRILVNRAAQDCFYKLDEYEADNIGKMRWISFITSFITFML
jgi:hypothetical protein